MPAAPHPANELERLAALAEYQIMDTPPEQSWDELVQLAAKIFNVPTVWVGLIDSNRQWFKAKVGIDAKEVPRELTFCSYAILNPDQPLIVPDATQDERFADNPFVVGEAHFRFYAGIPLLTPDHHCLGTFCVIDTEPRRVTMEQIEQLQSLAYQVSTQLELRRQHLKEASLLGSLVPTGENAASHRRRVRRLGIGVAVGASLMVGLGGLLVGSLHHMTQTSQRLTTTLESPDPEASLPQLQLALPALNRTMVILGRGLLLTQGINLAVMLIVVGWAIKVLRQQHTVEVHLRQDRDFTTSLINSAGTLVWVMDPEGKIVRFNIACERLLGYGMGEVLGRFIYDLNIFSPQSWTTFQDFLSAIHTSQRVLPQMDLYCRHRQGPVRLIRFYNSAIYGNDGKAQYISCMGIDITQQKQAQKALTDSEERYRDLFEGAHDLIQSVSPDGRFLFVNKAWLQRLGYQPDQVKSLRLYDVVHPKFRPAWNTMILQATVGDPINQIESLFMTQQGGLVAVEGSLSIRKEHGQVHSIRGIFRDVTRSKQAEDAIRRQSQRNRLFSEISLRIRRSLQIKKILQTTVDEVCGILAADRVLIYQFQPDRSGIVVVEALQNEQWKALQGTILRDPCFEQDYYDRYSQGRTLAIDDIEAGQLSTCYIQSLQQWQVKATLVMPVFLQNTLWGLLIVHQCSSPRHWRQGEIELLTQLATQLGIALSQGHLLEQEQEQRRQLAQRNHELQQARQVAEAAAAAKGIFLATMSHEVRTPLNAMLGTTELLQYTSLTSDQADLISTLQESGHALLELVNGILDLSKLEAEGIHLDRQTFDLRQVLEHSLDRFALAAEAKGVAVDLHIEPDVPPSVQGDPTRLRQILDHLLSNAVKFTDQGGVVVEVAQVRTELAAEAETTPLKLVGSPSQSAPEDATTSGAEDEWESIDLQIEIRDTGIGIDADYLAFLFQPFSQRDGSTTRRYGGTGLGLALCKQLTLLMGGQIGVKSVPHQGSSFTVTLPFGVSRPENTDLPSQLGEPQPGLKGRRLLVTTSAIRGQIIASLTQSWGMQVEWVANLRQGWEQWQSAQAQGSPYDVWVVDQAVWDQAGWQQGWDPSPQARLDTVPWLMIASPAQFSAFDWDLPITLVSPPLKQSILQSTLFRLLGDQPSDPQIEWPVAAPAQSQDRLDPVQLASPRHLGFAVKVPASPPQGSHQPTILVVEDNPVNRKLIVRQLNTLGFAADTADHGQTALERVDQQPYDIILMDCMMPVMDGYTASRLIRQREAHSTGPDQQRIPTTIIAVTANAFSQDRDQCLAAGMDDYLSKPISVDRLEAILHHWIQVRSQLMPPASIDSQAPPESAPTQRQDLPLQAAEPEDPPVVTSHTSTSPINLEWLTQISGGDHDFEQELIDTFLEDSAQQRLLIREAVQTCNFGQLAQLAHRMKGASGNLGAEDLQHCSLQLELAAKQGDPQGSQQWLVTLETLLDSLERWVKVSAGS